MTNLSVKREYLGDIHRAGAGLLALLPTKKAPVDVTPSTGEAKRLSSPSESRESGNDYDRPGLRLQVAEGPDGELWQS
jgi:hypothetical protein